VDRYWWIVAVVLSVAACGARSPQSGAATAPVPRGLHAEIRDTSVDALPDYRIPVSPDLVFAIVDVSADAITFGLRLRPGSFDAAATRFAIDLDIDQNAATGSAGIEYSVTVFPAGGRGADVARTTSTGPAVLATVPVRFVEDGCDVAIPRALLGTDDGRFDFRVQVYAQPAFATVIDVIPDVGLVRIE
jgi:hypothetical protein